jgi:hypothetical protein
MGLEGGADAVGISGGVKPEQREQRPEAAPATGEHAGPRGDGGVAELQEDVDQNVVGKRAEAALAAAIGELGSLGGDLPGAVLHGESEDGVAAPHIEFTLGRWRRSKGASPNAVAVAGGSGTGLIPMCECGRAGAIGRQSPLGACHCGR